MKWRKYRRILGVLAVSSIAVITLGATDKDKPIKEMVYVVQPGDTLWSIASKNVTDEDNILAYIHEMKKANPHIKTDLQIGEKIIIKKHE